jgi:hypothetical protein
MGQKSTNQCRAITRLMLYAMICNENSTRTPRSPLRLKRLTFCRSLRWLNTGSTMAFRCLNRFCA